MGRMGRGLSGPGEAVGWPLPVLRQVAGNDSGLLVAPCPRRGLRRLQPIVGVVGLTEQLSQAAKAYLQRLEEWAVNYEENQRSRKAAYWTEERREQQAAKLRAYWTPARRYTATRATRLPPKHRRVVPDLPAGTRVWRSSQSSACYHLSPDCPAIGPLGLMKLGRLGAAKAAGRRLCYYESFHWKPRGV